MNYGKRRRSGSYTRNVRRRTAPYRKRRTRVQRRRRGRKASIKRSIPDFTMVALPYSETRQMTNLNAHPGTTLYAYRLNSLFDPYNPQAISGQPLGFDQYSAFFQRYRVHATKYHVTWFNPGSVNGTELRVGTYVAPDGTAIPAGQSFSIMNELPNAKSTHLSVAPGASWRANLSGFQRLSRLQGVSKADYNGDDDFEAEFGANPIKSPLLYLYAWNPQDFMDNATVYYEIKMTFYASLFKRKPLSQS